MPSGVLARRLGRHVELTPAERAMLDALEGPARRVARGAALARPGEAGPCASVLLSGWAAGLVTLADGRRQIVRICLPGDLIGLPGAATADGTRANVALTDVEVAGVTHAALADLIRGHPRLAGLLLQLGQLDAAMLGDRLAAIGRSDARARVAGLLCDLACRMRAIDPAIRTVVPLPLTQEDMGDALGLTGVHVNRMLRALADAGMIRKGPGVVTMRDEAALLRLSGYVDRMRRMDTDWLPPPAA